MKFAALGMLMLTGGIGLTSTASAQFDKRTIETIGVMFLADQLGIDANTILSVTGNTKYRSNSVYDMAPAFGIQRYAPKARAEDVWRMRRDGLGWGQIAQRLGIHPGEFNKLRNSGIFEPGYYWRNSAESRLGVPTSIINYLVGRGMTWPDLTVAAVVSRESGRSITDVSNAYLQSRNWNVVAADLGVTAPRINSRIDSWRKSKTLPDIWRGGKKDQDRNNGGRFGGNNGRGRFGG